MRLLEERFMRGERKLDYNFGRPPYLDFGLIIAVFRLILAILVEV